MFYLESMVPPSQPTTSNSHRRLFVAPKPVQAAQVIRQPTKDTRRVVIKREPTTPKKSKYDFTSIFKNYI